MPPERSELTQEHAALWSQKCGLPYFAAVSHATIVRLEVHLVILVIDSKYLTVQQVGYCTCMALSSSNVQGGPTLINTHTSALDEQHYQMTLLWYGVVWCGVVWCGVVWCGVVWCGVVWCGVV